MSKFTSAQKKAIIKKFDKFVAQGMSTKEAGAAVGVAYRCIWSWKKHPKAESHTIEIPKETPHTLMVSMIRRQIDSIKQTLDAMESL